MRKQAQRLSRKCGLVLCANTKPGRHLPFHHPQMQKVRAWINFQISSGEIHGRLLCNFDQVWSLLFRPCSRSLQSRATLAKPRADPYSTQLSLRKIRHCIERVMDLPIAETFESETKVGSVTVQGGAAACSPVDTYRMPRTLTTVSWADGTMGRGFVTCRSDYLCERDRLKANQAG